jgi:hypothetical protein
LEVGTIENIKLEVQLQREVRSPAQSIEELITFCVTMIALATVAKFGSGDNNSIGLN